MSDEPIGSLPPQPRKGLTPWIWVPTLYFAESLPYAVVTDTSKFLYTDLGVGAAQLGVITGAMNLPWVVKPLWSPLVDLVKTKRWWIGGMQLLIAACFFALAGALNVPNWLLWTSVVFWVMAATSATHDIAADGFYMLGLNQLDQAAYNGVRGTAYKLGMLAAKGALLVIAGYLTVSMGKIHGWSAAFCVPGVIYAVAALFHLVVLPRPAVDKPAPSKDFWGGYVESFASFFRKPGIGQALAFMLLFRLAEAQLLAMVAQFLKKERSTGALGLTTQEVGIAYGTVGMCGIICGGLLGGYLVSRFGLRRLFWPLIITLHVPNVFFLILSLLQPTNLAFISACLFIEQFGYGFGFTAYTLFLMYFAKGENQTSHYAICTGFMAMGVMLPGMVSGYVQTALGFKGFFIYIMVCTLPSFWVAWMAWRNKEFIDTFQPAPTVDPPA